MERRRSSRASCCASSTPIAEPGATRDAASGRVVAALRGRARGGSPARGRYPRSSPGERPGAGRVDDRQAPAAAMVAELASSGGGAVLALVADPPRRAPLAREGARLAEYSELEARARAGARVRARRPRRPAALRRASSGWSRSPGARAAATCTRPGASPSCASRSRAPRPAAGPAPGADRASSATCARPASASGEELREALAARGRTRAGPRPRRAASGSWPSSGSCRERPTGAARQRRGRILRGDRTGALGGISRLQRPLSGGSPIPRRTQTA